MEWLLKPRKNDPVREVEEQPNVKEAIKQIRRARVLIELDHAEAVARGRRRRKCT